MIWIVGAKGMLGQDLAKALSAQRIAICLTDREVDFTDLQALKSYAAGKPIRWIVNAAAYTAVDKAEDEQDLCYQVNVLGARNLAILATSLDAALVHISTDYVFDGNKGPPWRETDPISPQNVYGKTKAQGEDAVRENCPRHLIFRTAWLYGAHGPNFVFTMLRLMNERETISVVSDQWGSPTWTLDLVQAITDFLQLPETPYGTYHVSANGLTNWYDYARKILSEGQLLGLVDPRRGITIQAVSSAEYPTKAKRPTWSVLDKSKVEEVLGTTLPHWEDSLKKFMKAHAASKDIL